MSVLTNGRELRALQIGEALNGGTPMVWGLSALVPRLRGREFLRVGELPKSPWCGGLEYMPDVDGDDGAAGAPYVRSLPLYTMETRTTTWVLLCMQ